MSGTPIAEDWYRRGFNALYPVVYAHRTVEAAEPEAAFAAEQLGLSRSDCVLDLCCGNGRHMVHLARQASTIVGLDYSPDLLALATDNVGRNAWRVRGDMRALPFGCVFDVVVNFFTSFGYFVSREENLEVVREVARVLKPAGRFFIDYLNPAAVERTLVPESVRDSLGYTIRETRWIDRDKQRVNKTIAVSKDGRTIAESGESVRLYEREELLEFLSEAGLRADRVFGDYAGAEFGDEEPRMILVGHKERDRA